MELLLPSPIVASTRIVDMATSTRQTSEAPVVKATTEARDGVTGHGVRYVLFWSIAAVASSSAGCGFSISTETLLFFRAILRPFSSSWCGGRIACRPCGARSQRGALSTSSI
jgi:hypothetical protein